MSEDVPDPALPIIDTHHHLWRRPGSVYDAEQLLADIRSGHNVVATIAVEAQLASAPPRDAAASALRETKDARAIGDRCAAALVGPRLCAGIVGFVDLTRADRSVAGDLEAQIEAAGGRLRGIRQKAAWHSDMAIHPPRLNHHPDLLSSACFRSGFGLLARHGLLFEAWVYHSQLPSLAALARSAPDTTIVLEHAGTPVFAGVGASGREEVRAQWLADLGALLALPNVVLKIGGLGMDAVAALPGGGLHPTAELVAAWRPLIEPCVELFGPSRCMFGSNFPVDAGVGVYKDVWSCFKEIVSGCSDQERRLLFSETAEKTYRL